MEIDERAERIERRIPGERLGVVEIEGAAGHGEVSEQSLSVVVEQFVGPADRRAQRAMTFGCVVVASPQEIERVTLDPREHRGGRQAGGACGSQLDRERETLEYTAQRLDRGPVALRQVEVRVDCGGPVAVHSNRRFHVQAAQPQHSLGVQPQRRLGGHEQSNFDACRKEALDIR